MQPLPHLFQFGGFPFGASMDLSLSPAIMQRRVSHVWTYRPVWKNPAIDLYKRWLCSTEPVSSRSTREAFPQPSIQRYYTIGNTLWNLQWLSMNLSIPERFTTHNR